MLSMLIAILCGGEQSSQSGVSEKWYTVLFTADCVSANTRTLSERALVAEVLRGKHTLVNASIVNGSIKEDIGSLSRLKPRNGVVPHILLATYVSSSERVIGYILASQDATIVRVRPDALFAACEQAKSRGVSFIQNGIYRKTENGPQIACYPNKPFVVIHQSPKVKRVAEPAKVDVSKNKKNLSEDRRSKYSPAQLQELDYAVQNGVNPIIIANPKLTAKQMRVLWLAKKNRICVEYFANPKFSDEQMQFLSDRLVSKQVFQECKIMINPKFNVNQMAEIYLGAMAGLDVSVYAKPELSAERMQTERALLDKKTYGKLHLGGQYTNSGVSSDVFKRIVDSGSK